LAGVLQYYPALIATAGLQNLQAKKTMLVRKQITYNPESHKSNTKITKKEKKMKRRNQRGKLKQP